MLVHLWRVSRLGQRLAPSAMLLALSACAGAPEVMIRVQGTVRSVGMRTPIPGAEVTLEWPVPLGGGQSVLKTNAEGRFAAARTRRVRPMACTGLAITVQAANFATAYTRHAADCGDGLLSFDFALLPQPR